MKVMDKRYQLLQVRCLCIIICVRVFFQCDYSCCCIEGENPQNSKPLVFMIQNFQNFQCVEINLVFSLIS